MQEKPSSEWKLEPVPGAVPKVDAVKPVADPTALAEKFNLPGNKPSDIAAKVAEVAPASQAEAEAWPGAKQLQGSLSKLLRRQEMVGAKYDKVKHKMSLLPYDVAEKITQGAKEKALASETKKRDRLKKLWMGASLSSAALMATSAAGSVAAIGITAFSDPSLSQFLLACGTLVLPVASFVGFKIFEGVGVENYVKEFDNKKKIENNFKSI